MKENFRIEDEDSATLYEDQPLRVSLFELQPVLKGLMRIKTVQHKRDYMRTWHRRNAQVSINIPSWEDIIKSK